MNLNVHLTFPGTCEEAIKFYQEVLGGEITGLYRYRGSPAEDMAAENFKDKIMHASLHTGGIDLMGADIGDKEFKATQGIYLSVNTDDVDEAARIFNALADGGNIEMGLEETFWAESFGMLTDRYGIGWMVNCAAEEEQAG